MSLSQSKSPLVILDTGIVIKAFEFDVWPQLIARYRIVIPKTVLKEAKGYPIAGQNFLNPIDLFQWIKSGEINVVSIDVLDVINFVKNFDRTYLDKMDPGELEALAYWHVNQASAQICSGDGIVYKAIGRLGKFDSGISLEELLSPLGLSKGLPQQFTQVFREEMTAKGTQDFIKNFKA